MEYARNVLALQDAQHAEYDPDASTLVIAPVSCPVAGRPEGAPKLSGKLKIKVVPGSLVHRVYGLQEIAVVVERFFCNFELNPRFQEGIDQGGLRITGLGERGEARIVELPDHPFFIATLFLPQLASIEGVPHPLIAVYMAHAARRLGGA